MMTYREYRLLLSRSRPWPMRYLAAWADARLWPRIDGDLRGLLVPPFTETP